MSVEEMNAELKAAVRARLDATPADDPKMRGYSFPVECAAQFTGVTVKPPVHPTSQKFFDLCDALKEMHRSKSKDYGCPTGTDPLANIRNGAKFVGIPAWRGAMVRLSDKVTRLATFNATGSLTYEGVEDNLFDLASYALLSLLLYREEHEDGRA